MLGIFFAGVAVINNDAVQTLGTFMSSNRKVAWWKLWLTASTILVGTITWGWFQNNGDLSFGRLDTIPYAPIQWYHVLAPAALLGLTRVGIPVSTTFLVLSVFSSSAAFEKILIKSMLGYAIAACEQKQDEGYTWEYVGRQQRNPDALAIPIIREDTGEEIVYWRLTK